MSWFIYICFIESEVLLFLCKLIYAFAGFIFGDRFVAKEDDVCKCLEFNVQNIFLLNNPTQFGILLIKMNQFPLVTNLWLLESFDKNVLNTLHYTGSQLMILTILFSCLFSPFTAGRYHSLVIEKDSFPSDELEITAWTEDGLIMAARHKKYKYLQVRDWRPFSILFCRMTKYCVVWFIKSAL